jgi:hypothetical protein
MAKCDIGYHMRENIFCDFKSKIKYCYYKMEKKDIILVILQKSGIVSENYDTLENLIISREILLDNEKYNNIKMYLKDLKKNVNFSSSTLTCLHNSAELKQKWPLLNLIRQILKVKNFRMIPIRKSDGKDKLGKKKYKRFFRIEKYNNINTVVSHEV